MIKNLILLLLIILISIPVFSQENSLKFGLKYSIKNHNFEILDDVPNHKMGLAHGTGLAYFKDTSTAITNIYFVYDYINGSGNFIENCFMQFYDNSTITIKAVGTTFGDENNPLFTAEVEIISGTGIYKGIKGKGNMSGDRKTVLEENTMVYLNFELNYTIGN